MSRRRFDSTRKSGYGHRDRVPFSVASNLFHDEVRCRPAENILAKSTRSSSSTTSVVVRKEFLYIDDFCYLLNLHTVFISPRMFSAEQQRMSRRRFYSTRKSGYGHRDRVPFSVASNLFNDEVRCRPVEDILAK